MIIFSFVAIENTKILAQVENYLAQFKELERFAVIDYTNVFNRFNDSVTS